MTRSPLAFDVVGLGRHVGCNCFGWPCFDSTRRLAFGRARVAQLGAHTKMCPAFASLKRELGSFERSSVPKRTPWRHRSPRSRIQAFGSSAPLPCTMSRSCRFSTSTSGRKLLAAEVTSSHEQHLVQAEGHHVAEAFRVLHEGHAIGDDRVVDRVPVATQLLGHLVDAAPPEPHLARRPSPSAIGDDEAGLRSTAPPRSTSRSDRSTQGTATCACASAASRRVRSTAGRRARRSIGPSDANDTAHAAS